ncbi:UDP-3-O-(3-hydroxymyristoyl)glucosamine N-acyltransferase [Roseomonas xinghualingensis]|uniref:UDP-3-O-(3-hydroxymyristoyl)glucosamine N-acyltransferase n=1 Tax=Roseomonas xinghualingensis TaxID=2986475 RepID=UPI0021F112A2|nr:UDP-3-O-(3-hydroxymyristoyl)glucosamine N-acyltransferase [Roseomonas sp. SXEYE001]MCV4206789.1 UDP-3-O-(3-hydroxymyristoyl)glucosamine N-acyltransferase [Roseomonas sp. SXEYE001]
MAADSRFHPAAGPLPLAQLAQVAGLTAPEGTGDRLFTSVGTLKSAGPDDVTFLDGRRWLPDLRESRAGAVILAEENRHDVPEGMIALISPTPILAFARIAAALHPPLASNGTRHPTAVVAEDAQIGEGCEIGPYAVIEEGVVLGPRTLVAAHAHIGRNCVFGAECRILSHVTVSHCLAGDRVTLNPGARIGSEGFGFATSRGEHVTVPQLGRVILGDGVEVGANACIDRGSGNDTVLGAGTRLDNLTMLGHNVRTGRGCIIVAQAGISGSTVIGNYVVVAAQAGLAGHLTVGDQARIGAQAGVMADVPAGQDVLGSPALPVRDTLRAHTVLRELGRSKAARRTAKAKTSD